MQTKIETSKFLAIANKLGLNVETQPSQYKITGEDKNRRLYIPGTKRVHKVELSGWSHELAVTWDSVFPGKKAPSSKITHILNFAQDEKLVLKDFFKIAKALAKAGKKAPKRTEEPVQTTSEVTEAPAEQVLVAADSQ